MTDQAIVDWLELRERFGKEAFISQQAEAVWNCCQSQASRRLVKLQRLELITLIDAGRCCAPNAYIVESA